MKATLSLALLPVALLVSPSLAFENLSAERTIQATISCSDRVYCYHCAFQETFSENGVFDFSRLCSATGTYGWAEMMVDIESEVSVGIIASHLEISTEAVCNEIWPTVFAPDMQWEHVTDFTAPPDRSFLVHADLAVFDGEMSLALLSGPSFADTVWSLTHAHDYGAPDTLSWQEETPLPAGDYRYVVRFAAPFNPSYWCDVPRVVLDVNAWLLFPVGVEPETWGRVKSEFR